MSPLLHVLMLVDTGADAELLAHELSRAGFELDIRRATNEVAYLAALESPLDLILADTALSAFDATRALQLLRASAQDIPVIVITDVASEASAFACMRLGAADVIFKDRPARLGSAVARAVDQRALCVQARAEVTLQESAKLDQVVAHENITARKQAEATRVLLAAIVDASDDAIIGVALDGIVLSWNHGAEQVYGYRADQIIGQLSAVLRPPQAQEEAALLYERLSHGAITTPIETLRRRNDGRLIDVALTISAIKDADGSISGFSTISRDISARKRDERLLRQTTALIQLFQDVAVAANQAASLDDALQMALDAICTHIGWPIGHVYLPDPAIPGELLPTGIWHLDDAQRFATFRSITEAVRLAPGIGLPGQVVGSRKSAWIADIILDVSTPRTRVMQESGVRAGFALPVLVGDDVVAVLEFFATAPIAPDTALLEVLHHVGTQLGRVVERSRAEAALRESEQRFRVLFAHSPDAIVLLDLHHPDLSWPIVECNDVACRMHGYTRDELIGQPIDLLNVVAGSRAERATYLERIRHDGKIRFDGAHRRKDGSLFPIEVVSSLITVAGRELVLGIDRDISERKRAEDALRTAEARYRTLVEQIPAIIYTAALDVDSSTSYVSPQIEAILGFTPGEWLARPNLWLEQAHPDDRARLVEMIGHVQTSDDVIPTEYRSYTRDGRLVWLRDTERVVRDDAGQPLFVQGITLDITESKQAEEALRRSELRNRALIDAVPDMMFRFNKAGVYLDCRANDTRDLVRLPAEMLGKTIADVLPPDLTHLFMTSIERALATGSAQVIEFVHVLHKSAREFEARIVICGEDEVLAIVRNITERKQIERMKNEFVATVSHELRTPLTSIRGALGLIAGGVAGAIPPNVQRMVGIACTNSDRLIRLINDILDIEKIESGNQVFILQPISLLPLVAQAIEATRAYAAQFNVTFILDDLACHCWVNVDSDRLTQALTNLLANAAKFSPPGDTVRVSVRRDTDMIQVAISDHGPGIPEAFRDRLFQKFAQADSSATREKGGTGLGLSITKAIVERLGGQITCAPDQHDGATFVIDLPAWHLPTPDARAVVGVRASAASGTGISGEGAR